MTEPERTSSQQSKCFLYICKEVLSVAETAVFTRLKSVSPTSVAGLCALCRSACATA